MGTTIAIGAAVALTLGAALWPTWAGYQVLSTAAIGVALTGAVQTGRIDRRAAVFGLTAVAVLFNPAAPAVLPRSFVVGVIAACLAALAAWALMLQRSVPQLSMAQVLRPPDVVK